MQEIERIEEDEDDGKDEQDLIEQVLGRNSKDRRHQYCKHPIQIWHRNR